MALKASEAQNMSVGLRDDDGVYVGARGSRSNGWDIPAHHWYRESDNAYLGLIFSHESGNKTAYDFEGRPVDGVLKTTHGMVKRLARILAEKTAADAPTSCDACGYDIDTDDDEAQSTEENGETINVCGACGDEIGTLVLDARDGTLNRQAPRGARPEGGPALKTYADVVRVATAKPTLAGLYVNRTGEQYIIRENASAGVDSYTLRKGHACAGYTGVRRVDVEDWIASGWLTLVERFDNNGTAYVAGPKLVDFCEHGSPVGAFCGLCGCTVSDDEQFVKAARLARDGYTPVPFDRSLRAEYV